MNDRYDCVVSANIVQTCLVMPVDLKVIFAHCIFNNDYSALANADRGARGGGNLFHM